MWEKFKRWIKGILTAPQRILVLEREFEKLKELPSEVKGISAEIEDLKTAQEKLKNPPTASEILNEWYNGKKNEE
jgi:hypothetical protein